MTEGGRILAILVGVALTCGCGSREKNLEQQPVAAPATAQAPTPPETARDPTPPATAQAAMPPAAVKTPNPPATDRPPTPQATVQPQIPPTTVPPPTPPVTVPPPNPPVTVPPPNPPAVVNLRGNPMGAVRYPHAAHTRLVGGACDLCHHASKPEKPLASRYQKCQDCHTKVVTAPMKTKAQAAFHDPMAGKGTCVDCHLKENAAGKKAPVKCLECHKKENAGAGGVIDAGAGCGGQETLLVRATSSWCGILLILGGQIGNAG